jgi:flagellar hook-associated protein FlgK
LLDRRDHLVDQMASIVPVYIINNPSGGITIFFGRTCFTGEYTDPYPDSPSEFR